MTMTMAMVVIIMAVMATTMLVAQPAVLDISHLPTRATHKEVHRVQQAMEHRLQVVQRA